MARARTVAESEVVKVLFNALEARANWKRKVECRSCRSKLEIVPSDSTFVADPRDGDAYKATCAVCGHENWLAASLVPKGLVPQ